MKSFEYSEGEYLSEREVMFAMPSMAIGVAVLSLPKQIAMVTSGADGWISIVVGGTFIIFMTWLAAKLAATYPNQSFLTYASSIVTKPVAIILTLIFAMLALLVTTYVVRSIADIAGQFIFNRTPVEIISLTFLLVVVYAVSGSRAGLFRLNIMFLPLIIFVIIAVIFFNIRWFELDNYVPLFETDVTGYVKGIGASINSYIGFGIILFYISFVRRPEKVPKKAAIGMSIPVILYLLMFLTSIGVFGDVVTSELLYPTLELAKRVEIPGSILERIESIFFVIWVMAIFTTASMALDISILAIKSIFKKAKKRTFFLFYRHLFFI